MLLVDIRLTEIKEVYDCHQVLKLDPPYVDEGMLVPIRLQQCNVVCSTKETLTIYYLDLYCIKKG